MSVDTNDLTVTEEATALSQPRGGQALMQLAGKIFGKILSVVIKMAKGIKVAKGAMAIGSAASYAYIYGWKFATVLLLAIFIHELGHIHAMRRCGLQTKGIYFIPFLGGAAVCDGAFSTYKQEFKVALGGPLYGLLLSLLFLVYFLISGDKRAGALAGWNAALNLFQFLPVIPMDGGRMLRSLCFSLSSRLGTIMMALSLLFTLALCIVYGKLLFVILLPLGLLDLMAHGWTADPDIPWTFHRKNRRDAGMSRGDALRYGACALLVVVGLAISLGICADIPGVNNGAQIFE